MPPICSGGKTCARGAVLQNTTAILRRASANGQASPAGWRAGTCALKRQKREKTHWIILKFCFIIHYTNMRKKSMCEEISEKLRQNYSYEFICPNCIENQDLKKYVQDNSDENSQERCFLCKRKGIPLLSLGELLAYIRICICKNYQKAIEELYYDSKEGGYQGPRTDAYDLTEELLGGECQRIQELVSEEVLEGGKMGSELWTPINSSNYVKEDLMHYSWERFEQIIRYKYRYTFLALESYSKEKTEIFAQSPVDTLKMLEDLIKNLNLFYTLSKGSVLYRARASAVPLTQVQEVCAPTINLAKDNRMSPRGIPMFYCSTSEEVAAREIKCATNESKYLATFTVLKDLTLLDLTQVPQEYSIFSKYEERNPGIRFFNSFITEISKPVSNEENFIEYIPTQILSEYFRYFIRTPQGKPIDGIRYSSSQIKNGINYALFFTSNYFEGVEGVSNPVFKLQNIWKK